MMANATQIYFFYSTSAAVLCYIIDLISNFRGMLNSLTGLCLHFPRAKIALLSPLTICVVLGLFLVRVEIICGEINRCTVRMPVTVQIPPLKIRVASPVFNFSFLPFLPFSMHYFWFVWFF